MLLLWVSIFVIFIVLLARGMSAQPSDPPGTRQGQRPKGQTRRPAPLGEGGWGEPGGALGTIEGLSFSHKYEKNLDTFEAGVL